MIVYEWNKEDAEVVWAPYTSMRPINSTTKWFSACGSEIAGTFLFVFMIMICTDKKTQFSSDRVINCFIMASSYVSARLFAGGPLVTVLYISKKWEEESLDFTIRLAQQSVAGTTNFMLTEDSKKVGPLLNPALALGQMLFSFDFTYFAQYLICPIIGGALSLVFYEFIFVKSQEYLNDNDSEKELSVDGRRNSSGGMKLELDNEIEDEN